jgi:hypothetical protein
MILTASIFTKIALPLQHFAEICAEVHENSTSNLVARVSHGGQTDEVST